MYRTIGPLVRLCFNNNGFQDGTSFGVCYVGRFRLIFGTVFLV